MYNLKFGNNNTIAFYYYGKHRMYTLSEKDLANVAYGANNVNFDVDLDSRDGFSRCVGFNLREMKDGTELDVEDFISFQLLTNENFDGTFVLNERSVKISIEIKSSLLINVASEANISPGLNVNWTMRCQMKLGKYGHDVRYFDYVFNGRNITGKHYNILLLFAYPMK